MLYIKIISLLIVFFVGIASGLYSIMHPYAGVLAIKIGVVQVIIALMSVVKLIDVVEQTKLNK